MSRAALDAAIGEYVQAVEQGWRDVCEPREPLDPIELADASRFLAAIAEGALTFVHADSAAPQFVPWITPDRRWADNGRDSKYWMAPVDGGHCYRVHGTRGGECYLSFTVYSGTPGHPEGVALNVNHLALGAGPGDDYELVLEPPADACYVICRQYSLDPDRDAPATMHIDVVDGPAPAIPDAETIAARWQGATGFVRAMTRPPVIGSAPSYASTVVNEIGVPAGWSAEDGGGRGTPDQTYALGRFRLADDEALVMEVRIPPCGYASVVLWNRFGQSIDTRLHRATINHTEMTTGPDGSARLVVAHRDPGVPNWLDTGGRRLGTVFWRFLLATEQPEPIGSRVLPLTEVPSTEA